ncbi:hypothetical protein RHMOL_Rhmol13G0269400 [Rhododendron molle]|uniref:Uncharacterized protein n=1 Tax=Rhododendron molle TaxID=49168 RepID=A0ACC0LBJ0_RHOML|nr:hypothetical protein RHMOL_Rhmol13G0269400 [Rhododendron molle]
MGVSLALGRLSIAYGMVEELGPFHIEKDEKTLCLNPYAWNQGIGFAELSFRIHSTITRGMVAAKHWNLRAKATLLSYGILETPDLYNEVL